MRRTRCDKRQSVYLVGNTEAGYIKIGISKKPHERIDNLQTAFPFDLEIYSISAPVNNARFHESYLHHLFERYHIRGEWFKADILEKAHDYIRKIK